MAIYDLNRRSWVCSGVSPGRVSMWNEYSYIRCASMHTDSTSEKCRPRPDVENVESSGIDKRFLGL